MDLIEDAFHQGDLIGVVVDHEIGGKANGLAIDSQPAGTHAVERTHVQASGIFAKQARGTFAHFAGGLVRKRHRKDAPRRYPVFDDEVSDAMRYDSGFATSWACKNEHGAIAVRHGVTLRLVQPLEKFRLGGDSFHRCEFSIRSPGLTISASPESGECAMVFRLGGPPSGGMTCGCS